MKHFICMSLFAILFFEKVQTVYGCIGREEARLVNIDKSTDVIRLKFLVRCTDRIESLDLDQEGCTKHITFLDDDGIASLISAQRMFVAKHRNNIRRRENLSTHIPPEDQPVMIFMRENLERALRHFNELSRDSDRSWRDITRYQNKARDLQRILDQFSRPITFGTIEGLGNFLNEIGHEHRYEVEDSRNGSVADQHIVGNGSFVGGHHSSGLILMAPRTRSISFGSSCSNGPAKGDFVQLLRNSNRQQGSDRRVRDSGNSQGLGEWMKQNERRRRGR